MNTRNSPLAPHSLILKVSDNPRRGQRPPAVFPEESPPTPEVPDAVVGPHLSTSEMEYQNPQLRFSDSEAEQVLAGMRKDCPYENDWLPSVSVAVPVSPLWATEIE